MEQSLVTATEVFARLLELHNPTTGAHSRRVAAASEFIAIQMNMTVGEIADIRIAALLHDMGKISIPAQILKKELPQLTPAEKTLINEHPVIGEEILEPVKKLENAVRLIRHHHENYDGTGWPDGLCNDAIPIGSRIIAVANIYDKILYFPSVSSMTARRDFAATHLNNNAGTLYDPSVVNIFVEFLDVQVMVDGEIEEVPVPPLKLKEGMVLSRDLYTSQQMLVLLKDTKIGGEELKKVSYFNSINPILNPAHIYVS